MTLRVRITINLFTQHLNLLKVKVNVPHKLNRKRDRMCLTLDEVGVSTRTRTRTTGHTYSVGDSLSTYDSLIIKKKKKKSNSRYPTSVVDLYREGEVPTSLAPERTLSGFSLSFFIVVTGKTDGNNVYSD